MSDVLHAFGRRVRALRMTQGMSQEALARRAGLHRTYVGSIERGERNVALKSISRLALALGVPPRDLFADYQDVCTKSADSGEPATDERG